MDDIFFVKNSHGVRFRLSDKIIPSWKRIGSTLGLEKEVLEAIDLDERQTENKLRGVMKNWFNNASALPNHQKYPLSWDGLRKLLEDSEKVHEAEDYFQFLENKTQNMAQL